MKPLPPTSLIRLLIRLLRRSLPCLVSLILPGLLLALASAVILPSAHAKLDPADAVKKPAKKAPAPSPKAKPEDAYAWKFYFTQRGNAVSKCTKISLRKAQELVRDKTCAPFKGENPPLLETTSRCGKEGGKFLYIFETEEKCTEACKDAEDGAAS